MASDNSLDISKIIDDVGSVIEPASGGTLKEYVEHFKSIGKPALLSDDGKQAWIEGVKSHIQRCPVECTETVDKKIIKQLLRIPGIKVISYMLTGDDFEPNCFDYICYGPDYDIESMSFSTRRNIRMGLRSFEVRLCTWDELLEKGFAAHCDTYQRHGYKEPSRDEFEKIIAQQRKTKFYDVWGAFCGNELAAWMSVYKVDDWAMIDLARSMTKHLKKCPNNAICYIATKYMITKEKRKYISYGASSVQVNVNEVSMHEYKIKMGYEAVPMHLKFELKPMLRPFICWPVSSWIWEKLAVPLGRVSAVRKIAGMSRLLSGREEDPLAWARNDISQGK